MRRKRGWLGLEVDRTLSYVYSSAVGLINYISRLTGRKISYMYIHFAFLLIHIQEVDKHKSCTVHVQLHAHVLLLEWVSRFRFRYARYYTQSEPQSVPLNVSFAAENNDN